jgi:FKBP-type peptidyl-prolyl cis-trans isomerase FkpA
MKEGSKYLFVIPPELAYGPRAMAKIPANSTLVFQIEVTKVE